MKDTTNYHVPASIRRAFLIFHFYLVECLGAGGSFLYSQK